MNEIDDEVSSFSVTLNWDPDEVTIGADVDDPSDVPTADDVPAGPVVAATLSINPVKKDFKIVELLFTTKSMQFL